jgi:hypothetical protein
MNRRFRDLETLTCVEKFQIRLKCVRLWSGELGVVDWERAVSGWLLLVGVITGCWLCAPGH